MPGEIEGRRRKGATEDEMDKSLRKVQEMVKDREAWHAVIHEFAKNWTQLRY